MAKDDWMFDNTGGELTPKTEEEGVGSKIAGALGRTLEALPDALAKQKPLIGMPLQALFNTDEYQARQAGYQMAKERLADWRAGAELRKKERENASAELDRKAVERGEWYAGAGAREAERKLRESRAKAALAAIPGQQALQQEKLDNQYYETVYNETENNGWKMFSDTGMLTGMSSTEIENIKKDNPLAFRVFWEKGVAVNLFQRALKGDKNAEGLLDRWCNKNGLFILEDTDGKRPPMLFKKGQDGEDTPVLELSPDGLREFYQSSQNPVVAELNARRMISDASAKGNPVLRAQQSYLRAIVPFCGGSYVQANNVLKSLFDDMQKKDPIGYQSSFLVRNVNQAISDYGKGIPGADQELLSCIKPTDTEPNGPLAALGFEITRQGDRPEDFEFKRREANGEYKQYSFDDVREYMKENDVLGKTLQARIGFLQEASLMSMMRNARSRGAGVPGMGARKAGKPAGAGTPEEQEPKTPREQEIQARSKAGRSFATKHNVDAGAILNAVPEKGKIKTEEDVYAAIDHARTAARVKYQNTRSYKKANEAFVESMKRFDIPEEVIPKDIWAEDELEEVRAELKELDRKRGIGVRDKIRGGKEVKSDWFVRPVTVNRDGDVSEAPSQEDWYLSRRLELLKRMQALQTARGTKNKKETPEERKKRLEIQRKF